VEGKSGDLTHDGIAHSRSYESYMDGVDANPVYETRTPATDSAPLAKESTNRSPCVLGSRPMHILPPVIVVVVVAPAFDNDAIVQRANAAPRQ